MGGELGAVIEGEGVAQGRRKRFEEAQKGVGNGQGSLIGLAAQTEVARGAFVKDQDSLAVFPKEHQIGFPVAGLRAVVDLRGALVNGDAVGEMQDGASAARAEASATRFAARQEAMPVILLGGAMIDETGDRLMGDHRLAANSTQATGNLFGRPALEQELPHLGAKERRGGELVGSASLTTSFGESLSAEGGVTPSPGFSLQAIAAEFPGEGSRRAP